jgi:hypothetical protein
MNRQSIRLYLHLIMGVLGVALISVAAAWWWLVFRQVIENGYLSLGDSAYCAGLNSTICDLAMSLCKSEHFLGIKWYSPSLLWLGTAIVFVWLYFYDYRMER